MIILSPVSKFRVHYEIAQGEPYSHLHHLILKAIASGCTSQQKLIEIFRIHPRLLIQVLVTLTEANWVALGNSSEQQFLITQAGQAVLKEEKLPELVETKPKTFLVLLDRITGMVMPANQVPFNSKLFFELRKVWDKNMTVRPIYFENKVDEGEVINLLPIEKGSRLHWVGPIEMISRDAEYMVIEYDEEQKDIINLPTQMASAIKPYIEAKVDDLVSAGKALEFDLEVLREIRAKRDSHMWKGDLPEIFSSVQLTNEDVITGQSSHETCLENVLLQACSDVYIASSMVSVRKLEALNTLLTDCLERGVDIHIVRGYQSKQDSLDWVRNLGYQLRGRNDSGQIVTNWNPALSNANMLLWNTDENTYHCVIGTYGWLEDIKTANLFGLDISLSISHPFIVSHAARWAASLWLSSSSERLSSVPDHWRRISTLVETQPDTSTEGGITAEIRIGQSREYPLLLNYWAENTTERLYIYTSQIEMDHMSVDLLQQLAITSYQNNYAINLLYNQSPTNPLPNEEIFQAPPSLPTWVEQVPYSLPNVLISDENFCISSHNFFDRSHADTGNLRSIGVIGRSKELSDKIMSYLKESIKV